MLIQPSNNIEENNNRLRLESFDEEIAISMPLIKEEEEQEQEEISKVSYTNIIYRYIVTPRVFFSHVYESITTMSWKFYS